MPVISTFFGIIVRMFYRDHEPAHFHAEYQGEHGIFTLDGRLRAGGIRSRVARSLIEEWALLHQVELADNWEKLKRGEPLDRIEPLE